ncbi:pyrroline-5-carboxylate reductase [Phorcysia thermohydrogeniphila]|uniref:Pyrroline-5-carboxylate reductase n=1 Tax=Phorcysia thermohydrogeniphila TaxID=936138 RepID=A0A4R1GA25_9BACT|nr:pyrroline-5-carboxylate reductase [Phorcysia thermohydrogeniphila]TCK04538.1 pyrroline-5-carboxylate reductase [Phorcysia thermohydrogeniphila]
MNLRVGFIGGGNMAEAFISAFVDGELLLPSQISVSDVLKERLDYLKEKYGVKTYLCNLQVVTESDVIFLAVKPQVMTTVLKEVAGSLYPSQIVVSMAAGYPIRKIEEIIGDDKKVVRIMPNILVKIRKGVVAYCDNKRLLDEERKYVKELLSTCSEVFDLDEKLFDAVTALAGSGPAFVFLILEALSDGGVKLGLPRDVALKLATQVLIGSAEMVRAGEHPEVLKDKVTSPAGTTIAGLSALEENRTRFALIKALEEACKRSVEITKLVEGM